MIMKIDLSQFDIFKRTDATGYKFEYVSPREYDYVVKHGECAPATITPTTKTVWIALIKDNKLEWYRGKRR